MDRNSLCSKINEAFIAFFGETVENCVAYGNGHINDTFLVTLDKRYILQRINHSVFKEPERVMDNIKGVTSHIRKKSIESGKDPSRSSLTLVLTSDKKSCFRDSLGCYWRVYEFIEDTVSLDSLNSKKDFYCCAEAFGLFQRNLADYPAETLAETIPDFHNTPARYKNFMAAVNSDTFGRVKDVKKEIDFVTARKEFSEILERAKADGSLPVRVTHNDTKLNNILFDKNTLSPIAVIDLDTVMPGYSVNDFGDSIRFGANTAAEDETDLSKVSLDINMFRAYAEGFLKGCGGKLTSSEIDLLPIGAMMMTFECGIRFLTDYLEGDVYFKIHRPGHNLDRARCQFKLLSDMEEKLPEMRKIIEELKSI